MSQALPALIISRSNAGFFSLFNQVAVESAAHPDRELVVFFNQRLCLYWSDSGWNGRHHNAWEYFFHPLSSISAASLLEATVAELQGWGREEFEARAAGRCLVTGDPSLPFWRSVPAAERRQWHPAFRKIADAIRPEVLAKVLHFQERYFQGHSVLGLHYRGPEKLGDGLLPRHAWKHIDDYLDAAEINAWDRVFMATDDAVALEKARRRLGSKLVARPCTRVTNGSGVHFSCGGPKVGEEALIECLLLARCQKLIHGWSNLSSAALILNPELPHLCLYDDVI